MVLAAVPFQLSLFPIERRHHWYPSPQGLFMREMRTAAQWLRSVIAYLEWRAGSPWRRLSDPQQRWANERWEYLDAARLVLSVYHGAFIPGKPFVAEKPSPKSAVRDGRVAKLCLLPRYELVTRLLRLDSRLTDRRLLSCFTKEKLAGMILDRQLERRTA